MIPSLAADIASLRRVGESVICICGLIPYRIVSVPDAFLSQEEPETDLLTQTRHSDRSLLAMNHVDAAWATDLPPFLHDLDCKFEEGVNLVVGPLGSGKTLLLLSKVSGLVYSGCAG